MLKLSHLASVSPSDAKTIAASLSQLPVPPQALLDYDSAFIPPYVDDLDAYLDNVITEVDKTEIPDLNEERASPSSLTGKRRATILSSNFLESQGVFTGEQASDDQKVKAGGRESPRARNPSMYLDEKRVPVHLVPDNAPLRPPPSPLDRLDKLGVNTGNPHNQWDDEQISTDGMEEPYQAGVSIVRESHSPSSNAGGINFF